MTDFRDYIDAASRARGAEPETIELEHGGILQISRSEPDRYDLHVLPTSGIGPIQMYSLGFLTTRDVARLADALLVLSEDDRDDRAARAGRQ